jgi:hypothetical protein
VLSGDGVGLSSGTDDGNGVGRGMIGVTAGPVAMGAGGEAISRGGMLVSALRRGAGFGFAALALAAFGAGFFAGFLAAACTFFFRAGAAFTRRLTDLALLFPALTFLALRFFAISSSLSFVTFDQT